MKRNMSMKELQLELEKISPCIFSGEEIVACFVDAACEQIGADPWGRAAYLARGILLNHADYEFEGCGI